MYMNTHVYSMYTPCRATLFSHLGYRFGKGGVLSYPYQLQVEKFCDCDRMP